MFLKQGYLARISFCSTIMKNEYSVKDKLTLLLLITGVCCFGVILPDSFSNHNKIVHFSAHFGMSFLLALCAYMFCTIKLRISKPLTYTLLVAAPLLIGVVYKYWEIASEGVFERFKFSTAIELTGVMTSMSQNISGLMAAILLIEGLVEKNLVMSAIRSGKIKVSDNFHGVSLDNQPARNIKSIFLGSGLPAGSQYSHEAAVK